MQSVCAVTLTFRRKKYLALRALVVVQVLLVLLTSGCSQPVDVASYEGDGAISEIPSVLNPGFRIEFDPFNLDSAHSASYSLAGLPKTADPNHYYFGLFVELTLLEDDAWPIKPSCFGADGVLRFVIENGGGERLLASESRISGLFWQRKKGFAPFGRMTSLRDLDASTLRYEDLGSGVTSPATLHVSYEPGDHAPDRLVRVGTMAGGVVK